MVVFTCSYCGDPVKKNQVEKHYQFSCRGRNPALTCVDCLKDFNGEEHIGHTSCVTEEERYSAKGFVSKPPSCKGKKKQENWEAFVRTVLERCDELASGVDYVLKGVCRNSGVPQKKAKFMNYCRNLFRNKADSKAIEGAWRILEEKREEYVRNRGNDEGGDQNEVNEEGRKRKRVDSAVDGENYANGTNGIETEDSNSLRKGKKQKVKKQGMKLTTESSNEDQGNDSNTVAETKQEKKAKRKKEKYEKQLLEIQSVPVSNDCQEDQMNNNSELNVKSKKNKKKWQVIDDVKATENSETVKKVNKKREKHREFDNKNPEAVIEQDEIQFEVKANSKFNWEETVVKLLVSKGELPLKRVEKKVVNEYMNSGVHVESIENAISKFHKKILKMSRVKVKKDVVKLVS